MTTVPRRWRPVAIAALAFILAAGSAIRLVHLERGEFLDDELNHYYAGRSVAEGHGPRLPSGALYERGADFTRMAAVVLGHTSPAERAVRLPSAVLGSLGLVIFAGVLWGFGGPWVAVWGTLFLAIYPEAIRLSRFGRFYTLQLAFGLGALYTGWRALRNAGARETPSRNDVRSGWLWALGTIALLLYAARVQVVSLSVASGWGLAAVVAAAADERARGLTAWRRSVPIQLATLGLAAVALLVLLFPEQVVALRWLARTTPRWAQTGESSLPLAYYYVLSDAAFGLLPLAAAAFVVVALRNLRLALYLFLWLAVPVALHSLVFAWKGERFILLAMPALFATLAIAAAAGAGRRPGAVQRALAPRVIDRGRREVAAAAVVAVVCLAGIVTLPPVSAARKALRAQPDAWRAAAVILRAPALASAPIGGSKQLPARYYWERLDFTVTQGGLERWTPTFDARHQNGEAVAGGYAAAPQGTPDYYAGVPVLTTPEAIRERFAGSGAVLIGIDGPELNLPNIIDPELRRVLEANAEELCRGQCGTLRLFHWRFAPPP
ncbi:MAG: hypothetical protein WKG32_05275 [Gemmatimonadaceae bacterium]